MASNELSFDGGVETAIGFGAAFAIVLAIWVPVDSVVADLSAWAVLASDVAMFAVLAGVAVAVLRIEGVRISELGLSRRHLVSALLTLGGVWVALNLLGAGIAVGTGLRWDISLIWATANPNWESLPAPWLTTILLQFFVVGLVEEFTVRGYFQTKVIALFGGETHLQIALGIVVASIFFGILHVPGAILDGASLTGVVAVVASRTVTGLFFGLFYELTHNLFFVALLHGLGNTWPLVIDWSTWSGFPLVAFFIGVVVVYLGATLTYRHRTTGTSWSPAVSRTDAGSRG